jgi:uncharacterized membrane protein YhaH (DUF805 family)
MRSRRLNTRCRSHWPRFLLVIPFLGVLWVPFYNRIEPSLAGIPFFYWYQLAWVVLGAAVVLAVYLIETRVTGASGESKSGLNVDSPGDVL